jgi:hypothetical protein
VTTPTSVLALATFTAVGAVLGWAYIVGVLAYRMPLELSLIVQTPVLTVLTILLLRLRRRLQRARHRAIAGLCPSCGYNLTGNTSGGGPERRTAAPQPAKSPASADKSPRGA